MGSGRKEKFMLSHVKLALLFSAVIATGATAAVAAMNTGPASHDSGDDRSYGDRSYSSRSYGDRGSYGFSRSASHFLEDYDTNHDGKVTKDEFNRTVGARFAAIAHGQPINAQQFETDALKKYHDREMKMFRRADWNNDGKLTLDEYMVPLRVKFSYADRDGTGVVNCAPRNQAATPNNYQPAASNTGERRRGRSSRGLCFTADLNEDGKVTHQEFDAANAKKFADAAHGGKALTFDQFAAIGIAKYQQVSARIFQRLDENGDGKLTIQEYAVPMQKLFAKLDKNHDGVATKDEIGSSSRRFSSRSHNASQG
jgi:Ca2+-binding EF-hand superfamily protein